MSPTTVGEKPTVPEIAPKVAALYARPGGGAGCCLHIVLDDGNVKDDHVRFCLDEAKHNGHPDCVELASILLTMSKTQRLKLREAAAKLELASAPPWVERKWHVRIEPAKKETP